MVNKDFDRSLSLLPVVGDIHSLKELSIKQDTVEILRTRRQSYFGHIARMNSSRCCPMVTLVTLEASVQDEDHGRDGWTTCQKTARLCTRGRQTCSRHVTLEKSDLELEPRSWSCRQRCHCTESSKAGFPANATHATNLRIYELKHATQ